MFKQLYLLVIGNLLATASMGQCQELRRIINSLNGKTIVTSASQVHPFIEPVQYERVDENGQTHYFVHLYTTKGSFLPQKGATVVFKDGARIQWTDAVVKSFFEKGQYVSRCVIDLPEDLMETFREKEIAFIKVSTTEQWLTFPQSQRAKHILNCVVFSDMIVVQDDKLVSQ